MPKQARAATKRERLTLARIEAFQCPPDTGQAFLRDTVSPRLAVRATPKGKAYIFEATLGGKLVRRTIGDVAAWPLETVWSGKGAERVEIQRGARQEAARLQALIDQGTDPRKLERDQRAAKAAAEDAKAAAEEEARREAEARKVYTLRALLEVYVEYLRGQGKAKSAAAALTMFRNHVFAPFPGTAAKPAREVTPHEVAAVVRRVMEAGKERTAGALRSYLSAAFNAAARAPFNPKLPGALIPFNVELNPVQPVAAIPTRARHRTLSSEELTAYIKALGDGLADQALKLSLYAGGQRAAQLLRASVEDWNPDTKTLRLFDGKGRRQEPREHLLPLAPKAAAIVAALVERAKERETPWLFEQRRRRMDAGTPGKRLAEIATDLKAEPFTVADIRRTTETMLAGMGISRDERAQLLSHGIAGVQALHYDRHTYTQEKRRALVAWERKLEALRTGKGTAANVTPIGKRRARA